MTDSRCLTERCPSVVGSSVSSPTANTTNSEGEEEAAAVAATANPAPRPHLTPSFYPALLTRLL